MEGRQDARRARLSHDEIDAAVAAAEEHFDPAPGARDGEIEPAVPVHIRSDQIGSGRDAAIGIGVRRGASKPSCP